MDGDGKPYFALYNALSIINWKENNVGGRRDLNLVVLEEQFENSEDEFSHSTKTCSPGFRLKRQLLNVRLFDGSTSRIDTNTR